LWRKHPQNFVNQHGNVIHLAHRCVHATAVIAKRLP
jgi:hypothetical protein